MSYYEKNAEDYIKMAEGYDGREPIEILKTYLEPGSTILELGMGPGTDFEILRETYTVTGSDYVQTFLDLYREKDADADLALLDAVTMEIDRQFDCIYSNKVLYHLTRNELKTSLTRQADVLNENGLLFHTFWYGDKEEEMHGLHFVYYTEETISDIVSDEFDILVVKRYDEMDKDDSIYLILRKK